MDYSKVNAGISGSWIHDTMYTHTRAVWVPAKEICVSPRDVTRSL